jgi:DNA (cytosine-5)-methyltransferase 1
MSIKEVRFVDLFAGIGGFRLGFEQACESLGMPARCVFTSEIKPPAIETYKANFHGAEICGDITKIQASLIPDFDVLLAGFPCQAFSTAGKREGFADTRGTLFFEIERILEERRPTALILENVEGLVTHDRADGLKSPGRTLHVILNSLNNLGYSVTWKVLSASDFGVPQNRRRIFIVGTLGAIVSLEGFVPTVCKLADVVLEGLPPSESRIAKLLQKNFSREQLQGKAVKDKRGGDDNIHSWDIGLKGRVTKQQKELLSAILRARRNKKWAEDKGITWMDGMPLTLAEIRSFFDVPNLKGMLDDLVKKGYLKFEHPKDLVSLRSSGTSRMVRKAKTSSPKGYNIITGKLSFEISKILHPDGLCPTLVATDSARIAVSDRDGLRPLHDVELLRLSGFPDDFKLVGTQSEKYDLIGNTVIVKVVKAIAERVVGASILGHNHSFEVHPKGNFGQLELFES